MTESQVTPPPGKAPSAPRRRRGAPATGVPGIKEAAPEDKRRLILSVAEQHFDRYGYERATVGDMAKALGVTKPFIYYYFANKLALYEAVCWGPTERCFSAMDFADDDPRPAADKLRAGLHGLISATIAGYPAAFFPYREPAVFSADYQRASKALARAFYARMEALLARARADGTVRYRDAKVTALAACSLPGFLYTWYQPDGRWSPEEMAEALTALACRVIGLEGLPDAG